MRVVKFGGSSVADVARMRHVAAIVAELRAQGPVAVVVSAMAGVTDALMRAGQSAISGDARLREQLEEVAQRHSAAWAALAEATPADFARDWAALTHDAHTLARRGAGLDATARDRLVARFSGWGERLVVGLLAAALRESGLTAEAFDGAPVMLRGAADADGEPEPSTLATRAWLLPRLALLVMRGGVPVLPGYVARDTTGALTTLGRNGSDHSAAVIAAALGAERLTIYSDVPGILTADPRISADAALLPLLTYDEAQRVGALGAKALHPGAVEPVARWGIPLEMRSSLAPHAPGSDITPSAAATSGRTRAGAWIVVSGALPDAALAQVALEWLPAWPLTGAAEPSCGCADAVVAGLAEPGVRSVTRTPAGFHLQVEAERAPAVVRALHATLRGCPARHGDLSTLASGA